MNEATVTAVAHTPHVASSNAIKNFVTSDPIDELVDLYEKNV